jgi:hypothetical protein
MSPTFNPVRDAPTEVANAALAGQLVIFVGAGISRLINCPSWDGFANNVLDQLVPGGLDFYVLSQILGIADPKKRLSIAKIVAKEKKIKIDYEAVFKVALPLPPDNIYHYLNSFQCSFVTTNYDKYLRPASKTATPEPEWRFFRLDQLLHVNLDGNGNVVHLHGCIDDPEKMIITTAHRILLRLLAKTSAADFSLDSDAVVVTINSPRGQAIEALIRIAYRAWAAGNRPAERRAETWAQYEAIFELLAGDSGDFEFATLAGIFLPQFLFMSEQWLFASLPNVFDQTNEQKWLCAIQGYAFVSRVYERLYHYLKANGDFAKALDDEHVTKQVKDKVVDNIAVAYVSGFEKIEDPLGLLRALLLRRNVDELKQLIWIIWSFRGESEKVSQKVLALWPKAFEAIDRNSPDGRKLTASLGQWIDFVSVVDDTNRKLIFDLLPYSSDQFSPYNIIKNIARISRTQPTEAFEIWKRLLEVGAPSFPMEDVETALGNVSREGAVGIRNAKFIASKYLEHGNDEPRRALAKILSAEEEANHKS